MATVGTPSGDSTLPVSGQLKKAAPITNWINQIKTFCNEAGNIDEANVDLSSADGIVGKSTTQTIAGAKTFSDITITNLRSIGYLTAMQGIPLLVTAGEAITAGDLVYVSAWDATNSCFTVKKAIATTAQSTTLYARYVAPSAIANAAQGTVYTMYMLSSQVTTGLTAGRPVWLSATGGLWTGTIPAVGVLTQIVGFVVTVHATTGRVAIELPGQIIPWSLSDAQV